ncbi:low temperature requirement protein A [Streptomyces sp. VRA16 Mangrove soil]|uniref:low temperature requirement protein A n=1 Tax=Streptomyces sp. VRA16 Mangrove soil TaxID=2817434 RepID=UPI001A9EBCF4|nr:low temperature requirement protein A [Streptomyces sp. VRA16 Mangrove soil]MBO1333890.1 low temperature requirement protein A [Streptomyces sp. VRA16 Mangrove soil]
MTATEPEVQQAPVLAELPRRATWFELFGDLVFVAAVGQATHRIGGHPGAAAVAAAAALFVPLWWTWVLYTVRANRADRDETGQRLIATAGLAAVAGMAVYLGGVGHGRGADTGFVVSYLCARAGVAALYVWDLRREPRLRRIVTSYVTGSSLTAAIWLTSTLALDPPARYVGWGAAMALELALPLLAGRRLSDTPGDAEHLRERFGLFTIIVIGESVLGFTNGLVKAHTASAAVLPGAAAFALSAGLWWSYFSASSTRPGAHEELARAGRHLHIYVLGHLPVQLGLAVTGGAVGAAVATGEGHLGAPLAACVLGGTALFLTATALIRASFTGVRESVVVVRLLTAAAVLLLLPLAPHLPVAGTLAASAALLAASVLAEAPGHKRRMA